MMAHPRAGRVCVVVPTYNERENVKRLCDEIFQLEDTRIEVLFVDDSSPDRTGDLLRGISAENGRVHVISRTSKQGIGSAYVAGFSEALSGLSSDVVVEMDADLQHPPSLIPILVRTVESGAGVAVASRYVEGGGVAEWGFLRRTVSRGANAFARMAIGLSTRDCTSGFRAYDRETVAILIASDLPTRGFEFQVAALLALKERTQVVEVPFTFRPRSHGKSKLGLLDVLRFAVNVARMALR